MKNIRERFDISQKGRKPYKSPEQIHAEMMDMMERQGALLNDAVQTLNRRAEKLRTDIENFQKLVEKLTDK